MDRQALKSICDQIYRRFPEVSGSQPKVQDRPGSQYLIIFNGSGKAADGRKIGRTVRVVADQQGHVLKVTTSR
jgi:hypothetical protein